MLSKINFLYLISATICWWFALGRPNCNTFRSCSECVIHKSLFGRPCRWCPIDKECHAVGAVATNKCYKVENVIYIKDCHKEVPKFDDNGASPDCNTFKSCNECVTHKSWKDGHPCRWCPIDKECHAVGAVATNKCYSAEIVVYVSDCHKEVPKFDDHASPDCNTFKNCTECVTHKSWKDGHPCRWCPDDKECHALGAAVTNKCFSTENVVYPSDCDREFPKFDDNDDCNTFKNCTECVIHESWNGEPCRWCPKDKQCRAAWAIVTNNCPRADNVVDINDCGRELAKFDENEAWAMAQMSAAAYSDRPENCFPSIANGDFQLSGESITENCPRDTVCFAFVAISHLSKAIVVAYRGSVDFDQVWSQAFDNFVNFKYKIGLDDGAISVYYYKAYLAFKPCVLRRIKELLTTYTNYSVYFTGHSLGGAIASVTSTMLSMNNYISPEQVKMITFGQPRVGTYGAALIHDQLVRYSFRVTHGKDPVVHYPTLFLLTAYHHGKEVFYEDSMTVGKHQYTVCEGKPFNEDLSCANGVLPISVDDHLHYYNVYLSEYGKNGCGNGPKRRKRDVLQEYQVEVNELFREFNENLLENISTPYDNVSMTCHAYSTTHSHEHPVTEKTVTSNNVVENPFWKTYWWIPVCLLLILTFGCFLALLRRRRSQRHEETIPLFIYIYYMKLLRIRVIFNSYFNFPLQ